jgi:hypothetical protein
MFLVFPFPLDTNLLGQTALDQIIWVQTSLEQTSVGQTYVYINAEQPFLCVDQTSSDQICWGRANLCRINLLSRTNLFKPK